MDFDQTCIDTLLGGGEELIRRPYFQGHTVTLKCPKYDFPALYIEPVEGF